jgi:hypothetical protein
MVLRPFSVITGRDLKLIAKEKLFLQQRQTNGKKLLIFLAIDAINLFATFSEPLTLR